jgi:RHS repeat-associated protein
MWPANLPYIIDGGVTVNTGVVLTLPAGVVVKVRSGNLLVNGILRAYGADANRVVFTSLSDVSALAAGLTLGRASVQSVEATLAPGDWGRIEFASTSSASTLNYVVVRYGGSGSYGSIYLNGGAPSISNSIISYSSNHGLYVSGASPILMNNTFMSNGNSGVYATNLANPVIQNNLIYSNTQYGVNNASTGVTIDATNNWWGSATGPTHSSNPGGTGDRVSNGINFTPWLTSPAQPTPTPYPTPTPTPAVNYVGGTISTHTTWTAANSPYVVNNNVTVNNGVILTIQPGVVVKFQSSRSLTVNGVLAASGTAANQIVFTSDKDDTYAGDTNGDGAATRPAAGAWGGIVLNASASASNLANVLVRFAGTGVQVSGSAPTLNSVTVMYGSGSGISVTSAGAPAIQNCILRDNGGAGISLSGSSPLIQGNVFVNNGGAAISMDGSSLPTNSGDVAYYNQYNGIKVSGTASVRGSWHRDLPYIIAGGLTVATGVVLTIEPGTVVKFTSGSLTVNGGLVANGTTTDHITFTSIHDDDVGGDTNNNGRQTWAAPGDWSVIQFAASSLSSSSLTYTTVNYGGVRVTSASPTIANNVIAYASGYGLQVETLAAPTIRDNVIRDNRNHGLYMTGSSAPSVENNQFTGNLGYAVYMTANCTPAFTGNAAVNNRTNGVGVSGNASASTTWKANLTYVIEYVTIDAGVTLILDPGTVVKFASVDQWGSYKYIEASGALVAQGTSDNPIVFTSIKDDSVGGDTNNDGSATVPAPRDWKYVHFSASSSGSSMTWVQVRYGGYEYCYYGCTYYGSLFLDGSSVPLNNVEVIYSHWYAVQVKDASPTITNGSFNNSRYGIYLQNAHATIANSTIGDNSDYGISGTGSNPTITGNTINNNNRGIYLYGTSAPYPSISSNTFANNQTYAASVEIGALPTFGDNNFVGTVGNGVWVGSGTLTANATLYGHGVYVLNTVTVEQGTTLTVQPAAIVKLQYSSAWLIVRGALIADGIPADKIVFTSERDDAVGGDTNSDGSTTGPAASNWGGIYFAPTAGTSLVDNALIQYAGYGSLYDPYPTSYPAAGITVNNASPTISDSTLQNNGSYGIYLTGASPTITGNSIAAQSYAIRAVSSSYPTITGNDISSTSYGIYLDDASRATISGNTFTTNSSAIYLKADALPSVGPNMAVDSTGNKIHVRSGAIASNTTIYPAITYVLEQITANAGVVLTLQPGAVAKFYTTSSYLLMRGRLAAQGTASQKIVLTAYADDTYGGDTNSNGSSTTPAAGQWGGVYLSTSDSNLSYVILKHGGYSFTVDSTSYSANLILNNVSPTVDNCTIARSSSRGIHVINAAPAISNNDIWGNGYGIYTQNGARPAIHNNNIHDNSSYGVYNADTTLVVDAINNSWGHDSGPKPVGAGNGVNYTDSGGTRTYWVAFDPWNGKTHWIEQNLGVLRQWIAYVAEPVNTATGNYTYQYQDLRIPGRGLSLVFDRYYNSQSTYQGALGYGWTFNYGMSVREEDGNALVTVEDGRVDKYTPDGSGGYTSPEGCYDILTKTGGAFTLKRKDQTRYNFDASGKLSSIVDKNGNAIALAYSGANLTGVTDPTGRVLAFSYDGSNRITQITDPAGRTIRFAYDEFSNLISVTDARSNATTYAYDSKHRLLTITDPNNHIFVTNVYDAEGRVTTQRDARLNNTTFSYNTLSKVTTVTDPRGAATAYTYDGELRLQSEKDAANQTISYTYDENSNRISVRDRRGNYTRYAYDAMGNTTVITDALGGVTTMTYDSLNDLTSQTDPLGRTTNHTYDAKGNLTRTTDASANSTIFSYDANGLMTSTTDARGNTTTFGYDGHGNQTSITDALGNTTTSTYDIVGRKLTETDALGRTTTYTYDANNNPLTVTDAAGGVTTYIYDAVGNRLTATDPLGRVTTYAYDQKDKLSTITNPLSGVTRYEYDANDNKIRETDPMTHTTNFTYNNLNRLTQVSNPLGKTTSYGYDVDGNRTSVTDANGKTTNFTYNGLNRLTQVTDPLLNTTTYVYDAVGNKIRVIDANNNTTYYEYDSLNRLVRVTDALGGVVQYAYDPVGNKTSMTDANSHVTSYAYDELNRLTRVTDPLGNQVQYGYDAVGNRTSLTNARSQATTYTYDQLNRLTGMSYPGSTTSYGYDKVGNRTAMTDTTGTTTYVYDALNRVTSVTNPGSRVVGYSYDAAGNRTSITYPDGKAVAYTYDAADRLTRATDWLGRQTNYTYDNVGNPTGQTNPNNTSISRTYDASNRLTGLINTSTVSGTIASFSYTLDKVGNRTKVVDTEGTTNYEYDKLYRLTFVSYPDSASTVYQYDPMGNRLAMTTTLGVTNYTYDAADRLLTAGATAFTWDADGNMLTKGSQAFTYNSINRLTQVVSGTLTVGYAYDGDGRRASKTVNGAATNYTYDTIAGLAYVLTETTGGNTTLYTYGADLIADTDPAGVQAYYHYDGLGSTRGLTNGSGQVTARYTYDAFGALRSSSGTGSTAFKFAGEQTDDEIGLIYLRARYYDPETGRFMSKDPKAGTEDSPQSLNRYVYSRNNPVTLRDSSGEFVIEAIALGLFAYGLYKGLEAVATNWDRAMNNYGRALNMIGDPNATEEDYDRAIEGFKSGFRDTTKSIYLLALTTPGTSLTGPANLPTTLGGLIFDTVKDKLWGAYVKHELGIQSSPPRPQTYNELPSTTQSESRLASRLGALSYQAWSSMQKSPSLVTASNYEAYIATTPIGRLVQQAAQGARYISQDEIRGNYVLLSQTLRQAGFNPAHPQPPPGGSK